MSSITEVSYSNMKSAMKRIFSGDIAPKLSVSTYCAHVKSEPVFYGTTMIKLKLCTHVVVSGTVGHLGEVEGVVRL